MGIICARCRRALHQNCHAVNANGSYGRKEKEKKVLGKVWRIELPPPGPIYIRTRRIRHTTAVVTRDDITKNVISNDFNWRDHVLKDHFRCEAFLSASIISYFNYNTVTLERLRRPSCFTLTSSVDAFTLSSPLPGFWMSHEIKRALSRVRDRETKLWWMSIQSSRFARGRSQRYVCM